MVCRAASHKHKPAKGTSTNGIKYAVSAGGIKHRKKYTAAENPVPLTIARFPRRPSSAANIRCQLTKGGLSCEDWCRKLWEEYREKQPQIPSYDEIFEMGVYKEDLPAEEKTEDFILDPAAHPLKTATGKIQVYAPELAELAKTAELPEGDVILPIPAYVPGFEGPGSTTDAYPLYIGCHHSKASTHSSYTNNEVLQKIAPYRLWINPLDAKARGIANEDEVRVFNDRGEIRMKAKVTTRIMPGVVSIPEGGLHSADMQGDRIDHGGCINTLCNDHPNPISRGSGQHSNIGQVEKVEA